MADISAEGCSLPSRRKKSDQTRCQIPGSLLEVNAPRNENVAQMHTDTEISGGFRRTSGKIGGIQEQASAMQAASHSGFDGFSGETDFFRLVLPLKVRFERYRAALVP